MIGLGVMVGGGIYTLAGQEAATTAGPAVLVSFALGAFICVLVGLCYAELSSRIPTAGGVYTFSYVAFREWVAWLVGWALVLELLMAAAVVSRVFTQYVVATLSSAGVGVPSFIADLATFDGWNAWAPLTIAVLAVLIAAGARMTRRSVGVLVVAKIAIVMVLIMAGVRYAEPENYKPFIPDSQPAESAGLFSSLTGFGDSVFGMAGILLAIGPVVFAYIGFDLISTVSEETKEPRTALPRGILLSLGIVTVLYLGMAVVLVGLRPSSELGTDAPMVDALIAAGASGWVTTAVGLGAVIGSLTVVIVVLTALSRVLFAMGRDGLLPRSLGEIAPGWNSPARAAIVGGLGAMALTTYPEVLQLADTLVLAALSTFCACAIAVLRIRRLHRLRGFRIPGGPIVPVLAILATVWLALTFPPKVWIWYLVWMAIGLIVYLAFGRANSRLGEAMDAAEPQPAQQRLVAEPAPTARVAPSTPSAPAPSYEGKHRA